MDMSVEENILYLGSIQHCLSDARNETDPLVTTIQDFNKSYLEDFEVLFLSLLYTSN